MRNLEIVASSSYFSSWLGRLILILAQIILLLWAVSIQHVLTILRHHVSPCLRIRILLDQAFKLIIIVSYRSICRVHTFRDLALRTYCYFMAILLEYWLLILSWIRLHSALLNICLWISFSNYRWILLLLRIRVKNCLSIKRTSSNKLFLSSRLRNLLNLFHLILLNHDFWFDVVDLLLIVLE